MRDTLKTLRTHRMPRQVWVLLTAGALFLLAGCAPPAVPPPEPSLPPAVSQVPNPPASAAAPPDALTTPSLRAAAPAVHVPGETSEDNTASQPGTDVPDGLGPETTPSPETSGQDTTGVSEDSESSLAPQPGQKGDASSGKPSSPLTLDALLTISEGMTYEEIRTILGEPGVRVAGAESSGEIYRWSASGLSFTARIENGRLVRKRILEDGRPVRRPNRTAEPNLDQALYDAIREGMTFDQVLAILGMEPQPVLRPGSDVVVYRWSDPFGTSFIARFENGVLVRKNGLFMLPRNKTASETSGASSEISPEPVESPEAGELLIAGSEDQEADAREYPSVPAESASRDSAPPSVPPSSQSGTAGENADDRAAGAPEETTRSAPAPEQENGPKKISRQRIRRASLPRFAHRIRPGSYEIRVSNLSDSDVKAALLSDSGGLRLDLRSGASQSVRVPEGNYVLYFIYDSEPETLNRGGIIPVSEWRADVDLFLIGESYDIRALESSGESRRRGRRR